MVAKRLNTQNAGWYRFLIGDFECTSLWDGYIHHGYEGIFPNADSEEMERLKAEYRLPQDFIPMDLNPVVVNMGDKLVLIDAGMGKYSDMFGETMGLLEENMAAAGLDPADVDIVLMTHLHPDHSFGLIKSDGSAVFPNAEVHVSRLDHEEWTDPANLDRNDHKKPWTEGTIQALKPYEGKIKLFELGEEVLPGVTTMSVVGHSSGQAAFIFESKGDQVVFTGDAAHHHIFDPIHPEWYFHMDFDTDPERGAQAKADIFERVCDDGILYHGYHFPFPGLGEIVPAGDGTYRWIGDQFTPRLSANRNR
ncbi:MBL fold metallo-hydrolase [Maritimibacter sp. DP07]|uniref:MBL fold metallo-hydrolase n=1 Tax=Maritimibacter harenae TaxID=2606218 RepID=A0A845MA13_9RHOB|nr:MBL fold metallo-hydrolase [Maritimibacter harenae]MZR13431.1 MBL fold metallo-hydrolase [Maritimibacter harenae]